MRFLFILFISLLCGTSQADDQKENDLVGYIQIVNKSEINLGTYLYIKYAYDYFEREGIKTVLLDLDTPGGEVFSTVELCNVITTAREESGIETVVYINDWAISAGSVIAYTAKYIYATSTASMGATTPVTQGQEGVTAASEKINSAMRAVIRNKASYHARNPDIAEAMVDKDVILVRSGDIIKKVNAIPENTAEEDIIITADKLVTLTSKQLIDFDIANGIVTKRSLKSDLNKHPVLMEEPFKSMSNVTFKPFKRDWKISFFEFLSNSAVSSILLLGMMLGLYIEITTPGFGFPGMLGLLCMFLIGLKSQALSTFDSLEIILVVSGLLFVTIDLFLIPGVGLFAIGGIFMILFAFVSMLIPELKYWDFAIDDGLVTELGYAILERLAWFSIVFIILIYMFLQLLKDNNAILRRMFSFLVLKPQVDDDAGLHVSHQEDNLIGKEGVSVTPLRLSGKVIIEGKRYHAVSRRKFIGANIPVIVEYQNDMQIVVKEINKESK
jgi:membrane-bound serine protease (ClpP class)